MKNNKYKYNATYNDIINLLCKNYDPVGNLKNILSDNKLSEELKSVTLIVLYINHKDKQIDIFDNYVYDPLFNKYILHK